AKLFLRKRIHGANHSSRFDSGEGIGADAGASWSKNRRPEDPALLRRLEPRQDARWLRSRSQDSRGGMELLFHGCRNKGNVLWRRGGQENPERIASDHREAKTATLQCSRDHRNRPKTFSWC